MRHAALDLAQGAPTPQSTPQRAPQDTPQEAPQAAPPLGTYDPVAATVRIQALRREGLRLARIAERLTAEGVLTRYGLAWEHSSVRSLLKTYGQ